MCADDGDFDLAFLGAVETGRERRDCAARGAERAAARASDLIRSLMLFARREEVAESSVDAVAVLAEHMGHGGSAAAPLARTPPSLFAFSLVMRSTG